MITLSGPDGKGGATVSLNPQGYPVIQLVGPNSAAPTATLEVDNKGAHLKFDRPGGGSSYLFLNNAGASGLLLIDRNGQRRLDAIVANDGAPRVTRYSSDGQPLP